MELIQITPMFAGLVPVVIAISQLLKTYKYVPARYIPIATLVVAVLLSTVVIGGTLTQSTFQGLLVGLTAIGLFSGARATLKG